MLWTGREGLTSQSDVTGAKRLTSQSDVSILHRKPCGKATFLLGKSVFPTVSLQDVHAVVDGRPFCPCASSKENIKNLLRVLNEKKVVLSRKLMYDYSYMIA